MGYNVSRILEREDSGTSFRVKLFSFDLGGRGAAYECGGGGRFWNMPARTVCSRLIAFLSKACFSKYQFGNWGRGGGRLNLVKYVCGLVKMQDVFEAWRIKCEKVHALMV